MALKVHFPSGKWIRMHCSWTTKRIFFSKLSLYKNCNCTCVHITQIATHLHARFTSKKNIRPTQFTDASTFPFQLSFKWTSFPDRQKNITKMEKRHSFVWYSLRSLSLILSVKRKILKMEKIVKLFSFPILCVYLFYTWQLCKTLARRIFLDEIHIMHLKLSIIILVTFHRKNDIFFG